MPVSLVFGASGAVGRFLLPRLLAEGDDVIALSRVSRPSTHPNLRWIVGDLHSDMPRLPAFDALYSLGPLDAFSRWLTQASIMGTPRVIAFGSMSIETKRDSADAGERALAVVLQCAEQALFAAAGERGCAWTLFRPTLIYGAGVDRSLTPIVRFAQRWRVFPRIRRACGLRQPVHADDLAAACVLAHANERTAGNIYALGGGERLTFAAMLERVRESLPVPVMPIPIPLGAVDALMEAAAAMGMHPARAAAMRRLRRDLIADDARAVADFGWAPRRFHPTPDCWIA